MTGVILDTAGPIATITLNRPESYNALVAQDYADLAEGLRTIDKYKDVIITLLQGNGKFFCAGANVTTRTDDAKTAREYFMTTVARTNVDVAHALYTHTKILVAALNGPALGIAAAFLGHFDFIYALPNAWIALPFTFLGLAAEGGSSVNFAEKLGPSLANEALIFGKKLTMEDLERTRFVNKVFPAQDVPSFHKSVRSHLMDQLEGLDPEAILRVKGLIKAGKNERNAPEATNLRESYEQASRFASGVPGKRFGMVARKEIRHKL